MDLITLLLVVLGVLLPSLTKLIDSVAYRNRASGDAKLARGRGRNGGLRQAGEERRHG